MASHFFTSFEVYSGSCELRVHLENFPFDSVPVLLPFDPPCAIQDTEMLVSITQNLLLVSDRNYGLQVYNVSVILEGYTYITLTTSPDVVELERNYTLKGLFRFDFVRSFTFGEQIGTLEAKLLSSEHLLLVKGYGSTNVFLLNIEDMRNPFIQRRFGNVFHTNSTSDVFSGGRSTLNERWVVSEVKSFHGGFSFWNIYDVRGASKLMPLQILLDEYQWVESLYWYDDNFVFKTASSFRIGIIQHIDLFLSSSRTSDAGESAFIEVRLDSPYLPSYAFTLQVLFLAQNSIELVYPTHNTDLILYSGQASEFLAPRFINGPNMNLTWHQTGEVTTSVQFSGYYRYTRFKAASLIPQNCSFVSLFTRSESFSVSKQANYIHLFCVRTPEFLIKYSRLSFVFEEVVSQRLTSSSLSPRGINFLNSPFGNFFAVLYSSDGVPNRPF